MMNVQTRNIDRAEQSRFDELAASWWDPEGESRPLHELNPARLRFIMERVDLGAARVTDIGCGGGILTEAMAMSGGTVTGIDIATRALDVARLHLVESGLGAYQIDPFAKSLELGATSIALFFDFRAGRFRIAQ